MLTRKYILQKLKDILTTMDPRKTDVIASATEDTELQSELGLSSVAMLYMVIAIEETFAIEFGDVAVDDFKTVGSAVSFIEEKLK